FTLTDGYLAFEVAFMIEQGAAPPVATSSFAVGIGDGTAISAGGTSAINIALAAFKGAFVCIDPNSNPSKLMAITRPAGGGGSGTASSFNWATNTVYRYQCLISGTDAADDTASHVRHYINGALIADHPLSMNLNKVVPFIRATSVAGDESRLV